MIRYCLKISSHYSGLVSGYFPDVPSASALASDQEELRLLARAALEEELDRCLKERGYIPAPQARGRITVGTDRFDASDCHPINVTSGTA